jgi:glutaminase
MDFELQPETDRFVSTGRLPGAELVRSVVSEAYERYRSDDIGANSQVYPALARVPSDLFGICVVNVDGEVFGVGDAEVEFTIMSVAKPFVFALVCAAVGPEIAQWKLGVNATGLPFNSLTAVERSDDGRTNPMVNPGAIATTSLVPGDSAEAKWSFVQEGLSRFAGRTLSLDEEVYASASATNHRNQAIARLLESVDRLYGDPAETTDLYTRQSCLAVTARDLAVMGATLADGGVNPCTGERVIDPAICRFVLAVMTTAGLYETSGDWLYEVGLPGKSGIGGGIVTVSPGKGALGTFAPPLDEAGNSVKGKLVARFLARRLGLDLFASEPVG